MKLAYPHLPTIEIEMQVEECAQLLWALQTKQVDAPKPSTQQPLFAHVETPKAPKNSPKAKPPVSPKSAPIAEEPEAKQAEPATEDEARPYKGKTNRRHRVLEILQDSLEEGIEALSIPQISAAFQERYPEEDSENLDQVVRDLMAKTDKVKRVKRGFYALG